MWKKQLRSFVWIHCRSVRDVLAGSGQCSAGAVRSAADWVPYKADVYRETHDVPEVESGWEKGQRDKGTKGQRDKGTKGQRDKITD